MHEFKLIVAGSRDFNDYARLSQELHDLANGQLKDVSISIVTGMARGADALAYRFAKENYVRCYEYPADWDRYGKRAGYMRNEEMGRFAHGLLAFWDRQSVGTRHMIDFMTKQGKFTKTLYF